MKRRLLIQNILAGSVAFFPINRLFASASHNYTLPLKGNIHHAVCRWCFSSMSVEALCKAAVEMGIEGIDLVGPKDWPVLKKYNLVSSMCNGAEISLTEGWNDTQYHSTLIKNYEEHIELVAKAGYKNLICFSGNSRGMDDETGLRNCEKGLKQILKLAEKKGVVLQMELLNSKVNHKDYMCHKSSWGVELCKRIQSENFKLLYDIYHMQVDEGDIISTIQNNSMYFGHYHTAGVPGRHEIDHTQELNYAAIMKAIVKTGFNDYVAQEFIPTQSNPLNSLKEAILICDV